MATGIRHRWTDPEMLETVDIVDKHPPGPARDAAGQRLVAKINRGQSNPIKPDAIGQALRAAQHALEGKYNTKPKPSKRLIELLKVWLARRKARGES